MQRLFNVFVLSAIVVACTKDTMSGIEHSDSAETPQPICGLEAFSVTTGTQLAMNEYFVQRVVRDLEQPKNTICVDEFCIAAQDNILQQRLRVYYPVSFNEEVFALFRCVNREVVNTGPNPMCDVMFDIAEGEIAHGWLSHSHDEAHLLSIATCLHKERKGLSVEY